MNYPASLTGEIWFDLEDMGFLDCPCYRLLGRTNWASFLGRCQGPGCFPGLAFPLGLLSGPSRLFSNPINKKYKFKFFIFNDINL